MNAYNFESLTKLLNTPLERRACLLGALGGIGLWAAGRFALNGFMRKRSIADLRFADFNALRGERFQLYCTGGISGQSNIVQLDVLKPSSYRVVKTAAPRQECFSLAFCAPKGL